MTAAFIELSAIPTDAKKRRAVEVEVATILKIPLAEAKTALDRLPLRLPIALDAPAVDAALGRLASNGATALALPAEEGLPPCPRHAHLIATMACSRCSSPICSVCSGVCPRCEKKKERSRTFFIIRVSVLVVVLVGVILYAWRDVARRRARTDWDRTLDVAIVLVEREDVPTAATKGVTDRAEALASLLDAEMKRHGRNGPPPFRFHVLGPVTRADAPPKPGDPGMVSDARYAWDLWRYLSPIDSSAKVESSQYDARIYLVLTRVTSAKRKNIEGASQQGGRVGIVEVELDETMADFALFVATHELFHTLGASDKYDASTLQPLVPSGLAEPDLRPLYPQRYAELMGRHRAISEQASDPPKNLSQLRIGEATAREIGWVK